MAKRTTKCKVRILCPLPGVYPMYQPEVGEVYEANYTKEKVYKSRQRDGAVCSIKILDKMICLRKGEYEILEGV